VSVLESHQIELAKARGIGDPGSAIASISTIFPPLIV
jgi:hypothetical protein